MNDAEASHEFAIVLPLRPPCFKHVKTVEARVVHLVVFEGDQEGQRLDGTIRAAMLATVFREFLICGICKFGQFFLGDATFSIFAQLVFWNNHTVEILAISDLESHVENHHDYHDETRGPKVDHRAEQERPDGLIDQSQKLYGGKSYNDAGYRVLR